MFTEAGTPHHEPHIHAYYQNHVSIYSIDTIELINGSLPRKQLRLLEAWIELHQGELLENWGRLQSGKLPYKIAPLK
ncbi:MAG: DUF4160 domain-containing protein [Deltaproteobacteria bacterium]|nr:DUF4160 domain-containing protein [Deltaproteobacteria bacterium]